MREWESIPVVGHKGYRTSSTKVASGKPSTNLVVVHNIYNNIRSTCLICKQTIHVSLFKISWLGVYFFFLLICTQMTDSPQHMYRALGSWTLVPDFHRPLELGGFVVFVETCVVSVTCHSWWAGGWMISWHVARNKTGVATCVVHFAILKFKPHRSTYGVDKSSTTTINPLMAQMSP